MKRYVIAAIAFLALVGALLAQQPVTINQVTTNTTPLKVDGSGVTQPVSGTFWQATQPVSGTFWQAVQAVSQSGTWTVQPGNTANTTAWKVDGSAVTQPVSGTFFQTTQPVSLATAPTTPVTGTFWQATQPVSVASGGIASGAVASGAVASGAFASGSLAAGACAVGCLPPAPGTLVSGAVTSAMTGTTSTVVVAAASSNYLYITQCTVSNASLTVSTDIILQDGSAGTTLYNLPDPAAAIATTGGGGATFTFPAPLRVPTSGNGLYAANVTTGSSTKISCSGFKSTVAY